MNRTILRQFQTEILKEQFTKIDQFKIQVPAQVEEYRNRYLSEETLGWLNSSFSELVESLLKSEVFLLGDFHTSQEPKIFLIKLLSYIDNFFMPSKDIFCLGFEFFQSRDQAILDAWQTSSEPETQLLKEISFGGEWMQSRAYFIDLLRICRQKKIRMIALDSDSTCLEKRDQHMAEVVKNFLVHNKSKKLICLMGEYHLANSHFPQKLQLLSNCPVKSSKVVRCFTSKEEKSPFNEDDDTRSILKSGSSTFSIQLEASWVKWFSYTRFLCALESGCIKKTGACFFEEDTYLLSKKLCRLLEINLSANVLSSFNWQKTSSLRSLKPSFHLNYDLIYYNNYSNHFCGTGFVSEAALIKSAALNIYFHLHGNSGSTKARVVFALLISLLVNSNSLAETETMGLTSDGEETRQLHLITYFFYRQILDNKMGLSKILENINLVCASPEPLFHVLNDFGAADESAA